MNQYDRDDRNMMMFCDSENCTEESLFYGTYQECINEAKDEGWKISRDEHNRWIHTCPLCATEIFK